MATVQIARTAHCNSITARKRSGILGWLVNADAKYRQRQYLMNMTDHQLNDLGISRADAEREAQLMR